MNADEFKNRTRNYGLRIIRVYESLPQKGASQALGMQLLRSGTSVGANYRAACRAKSRADFISKMGTVEEECDETLYWMETLVDAGYVKQGKMSGLMREGSEILALVIASINTARRSGKQNQSAIRSPQSAIE